MILFFVSPVLKSQYNKIMALLWKIHNKNYILNDFWGIIIIDRIFVCKKDAKYNNTKLQILAKYFANT